LVSLRGDPLHNATLLEETQNDKTDRVRLAGRCAAERDTIGTQAFELERQFEKSASLLVRLSGSYRFISRNSPGEITVTFCCSRFVNALLVFSFICHGVSCGEEIKHSFFIAGPTFTGIIDEEGREAWNSGKPAARDGFVLPNGNLLIAWSEEVVEMTRDMQTVFRYVKSPEAKEIGTAQRLENGKTLITELGLHPRLLEVAADGTIAVDVPLQPETDNAHMQTRMARKLANGNYLVPHLLAFKVKEYSPAGKVVQEFPTDLPELGGRPAENWPFTAIRIANGNTLVNLTHGNKTVELNATGHVVWKVSNDDFPKQKPFDDPCGGQRLPNGNTVICSYHSSRPIKIFEVTPDKKIVWTYTGPHKAHEVQILTTNGKPIDGKPMK
jgi:hypothetical protein